MSATRRLIHYGRRDLRRDRGRRGQCRIDGRSGGATTRNACAAFGQMPQSGAGRKHPLFRRRFSVQVQQSGRPPSDVARLDRRRSGKNGGGYLYNAEFFEDIMHVTEYAADKKLTKILVDQSYPTARWLTDMSVRWILSTSTHAVKTGGKIKFPSGRVISVNDGGLGLIETLFPTAENKGVEILYEARANGLVVDDKGKVGGVR